MELLAYSEGINKYDDIHAGGGALIHGNTAHVSTVFSEQKYNRVAIVFGTAKEIGFRHSNILFHFLQLNTLPFKMMR